LACGILRLPLLLRTLNGVAFGTQYRALNSPGQDPHVPFAGRQAIRARLEEVDARYEWHEVNAAHAFLRDEGPRYDPALFLQAIGWMLALFARTLSR